MDFTQPAYVILDLSWAPQLMHKWKLRLMRAEVVSCPGILDYPLFIQMKYTSSLFDGNGET